MRRRATTEIFRYRWIEAVPLRDGKDSLTVNWIGFEIDAKRQVQMLHGLGDQLSRLQGHRAEIVACGRARWKIENESFNVMKNHG